MFAQARLNIKSQSGRDFNIPWASTIPFAASFPRGHTNTEVLLLVGLARGWLGKAGEFRTRRCYLMAIGMFSVGSKYYEKKS